LIEGGSEYQYGTLSPGERLVVLDSLKDTPVRTVQFIGGEPLLCPDLPDLIIHAHNLGLESSLATNGTLINEAIAERLLRSGLDAVSISIDGGQADTHDRIRGHGSFDAAIRGIRALISIKKRRPPGLSNRLRLFIDVTITSLNVDELVAIVDLANDLCLDGVVFNRIDYLGRALYNLNVETVSISAIEKSCRRAAEYASVVGMPLSLPIPRPLREQWHVELRVPLIIGIGRCESIRYEPCLAAGAMYVLRPDGTLEPCYHVLENTKFIRMFDRSSRNVLRKGFLRAYTAPSMKLFFQRVQWGTKLLPKGRCAHCANHVAYGGVCSPTCPAGFRIIERDHPAVCFDTPCGGFAPTENQSSYMIQSDLQRSD
jgi:MoaA/NifB/PqqE/SkfB family radical SAM enzyme